MKKFLAFVALSVLQYQVALANKDAKLAYIDQYASIAVQEMHRTGIPASIKLAQALLESNAGSSQLATKANNHFGIKCGGKWSGKTLYRKDDDYRRGRLIKSCFRAYDNAESSFVAHSEFLLNQPRYHFLFRLESSNYKAWAKGLRKAGYATDPNYEKHLVSIIRSYKLDQYDDLELDAMGNTPMIFAEEIEIVDETKSFQYINDVRSVLASPGLTVNDYASQYNVSADKIIKYNEHLKKPQQLVYEGEIVYLQPKRKNFRGREKIHVIEESDNMLYLSQKYGVELEHLYKKNRIDFGEEPAIGTKIYLRGKAKKDRIIRYRPAMEMIDKPTVSDTLVEVPLYPKPTNQVIHPPTEALPGRGASSEKEIKYHLVKQGDTLYRLAKKYNLSVDEILELNLLDSTVIKIGQQLKIKP